MTTTSPLITAATTSSSSQARLLPSTATDVLSLACQSQPPNSTSTTTPDNSLNTSASPSKSGVQPASRSYTLL
ncbi:hypothetical protein TNCV_772031 [Trichonephila clavipes]|nr:hypothetical protein TNCV_772031 [Trichonephila clavipes]